MGLPLFCNVSATGITILTSVTPPTGPQAGGTAVTFTGNSLTGATSANLGGSNVTSFVVVNDGKITGTSAAHAPGVVTAQVVGAPGGTATKSAAYNYT